ncbi:MAG: aminotransferase class I/II-fold pyridoxal phosphate-dependent enzyme [Candidatus Andersenbacteria bacterium]|nr:aminotransferase class I/II-fold pyridoxal phosphate-dependent enzyme [bacterium]MDZ4225801.1 aminotransferase class I/II-fold pyridoxal phosphate-dependent enzyme [Candidatus Andersenbacteria bacterium]
MPVLTSLSPNTEPDDISTAWRTLFSPWQWRDNNIVKQAENRLSQYLNNQAVILTSSGRSAMYALFQALGFTAGDEIIIQAFTCVTVPASVSWVGAKAVFADINPDTYNFDPTDVERKITPHTKAIIIQHTFGIPGPIDELKKITAAHNILLIEDCAHSLGASHNNQPLGTFGDAAIFSFGRDKTLSCVFGGAVAVRNSTVMQKIRTQQNKLPLPPFWWNIQQLKHPIIMSFIKRFYFTYSVGKILLVTAQKLRLLSKAVTPKEKTGGRPRLTNWQFSPALAPLLLNQLNQLNRYTETRQRVASRYLRELKQKPVIKFTGEPSWLRFPVVVQNPTQILRQAKQNRILLGDWYNSPVAPRSSNRTPFYTQGACPQAEKLAQKTINLPTYSSLSEDEVTGIIEFMNSNQ